jgi:hypothetical protein
MIFFYQNHLILGIQVESIDLFEITWPTFKVNSKSTTQCRTDKDNVHSFLSTFESCCSHELKMEMNQFKIEVEKDLLMNNNFKFIFKQKLILFLTRQNQSNICVIEWMKDLTSKGVLFPDYIIDPEIFVCPGSIYTVKQSEPSSMIAFMLGYWIY